VPVYALGDIEPDIHATAFVHPEAVVIGSVSIGPESSVWPGAVLRGDYGEIRIGARTSIQDGTVVHATTEHPTVIGNDCVIGHLAHLEGCRIENASLVGSGSVVLHRAVVGPNGLVAAGAVVSNDVVVPPHAMALGVPARIKPDSVESSMIERIAEKYVQNAARYREELRRIS
jgi:carbonic anhydrase/acetyltransferase-like protein (isoleucine patch superfamily)